MDPLTYQMLKDWVTIIVVGVIMITVLVWWEE